MYSRALTQEKGKATMGWANSSLLRIPPARKVQQTPHERDPRPPSRDMRDEPKVGEWWVV